jgi:hypothetical protein
MDSEANAIGLFFPLVHFAKSLLDINFHDVLSANYKHFFATGAPMTNMTERNFEKCKVIQQGTNENR